MKAWIRTNDKVCHTPNFDINCRYCGGKMIMRFSDIDLRDIRHINAFTNRVVYKCPSCAWIARFDVEDDYDYLYGIVKERCGVVCFVPDSEEWAKESESIRKQLEALGYVGGR